ncbi:MAG: hypothetical protein OJF51_004183 [Nitrospira sp.]|jgi:hypothetical protein|nr:MAG: hypothetical protein OJF51_004183 [Nitrospira sp.]
MCYTFTTETVLITQAELQVMMSDRVVRKVSTPPSSLLLVLLDRGDRTTMGV